MCLSRFDVSSILLGGEVIGVGYLIEILDVVRRFVVFVVDIVV